MTTTEIIRNLIDKHDWDGLEQTLRGMTNMAFRRVERTMRVEVLPNLDNDTLWETLLHLIIFKKGAFLPCVTAVEHLAADGTLSFGGESVARLRLWLEDNDKAAVVKMCNMMMPFLRTEGQVEEMFTALGVDNNVTRLGVMLKVDSPLSYYTMFRTLKMVDDKVVARKCCMVVIKRANDMAFNAVCIVKAYFGLDDLPARFSLNIEPYELSHIDRDYDTFAHALMGKRPTIWNR